MNSTQTMLLDLGGIGRALGELSKVAGVSPTGWRPNPADRSLQDFVLTQYPNLASLADGLPEFVGFGSKSAEELNARLAEKGYAIRLNPWVNDGSRVGAVSFLDVLVEWLLPGEVSKNGDPSNLHMVYGKPAFLLKRGSHGLEFKTSPMGMSPNPVLEIRTKRGHVVRMMHLVERDLPKDGLAMYQLSDKVTHAASRFAGHHSGAIIPMVKIDREVDITWMIGMRNGEVTLEQAKQQVRFRMSQYGVRAESGTALGAFRSIPRNYLLEPPFLLSITNPISAFPVFVGVIGEDSMADPGCLLKSM